MRFSYFKFYIVVMEIRQITGVSGRIGRKDYFLWGSILFLLKYNIDRLIAASFNIDWFITDYYVQSERLFDLQKGDPFVLFLWTFLFTSLPFIWMGTVLTMKRLRDVGMRPWPLLFFFIPFVNLIMFGLLCMVPGKETNDSDLELKSAVWMPKSEFGISALSLAITTMVCLVLTLIFIQYFESYGWGLFVGVPFLQGFLSVMIAGRNKEVPWREALTLAVFAPVLFSLVIIVFAIEGLICLAMGFPILLLLSLLGAAIAKSAIDFSRRNVLQVTAFPVVFILASAVLEVNANYEPPLHKVVTSVKVDADIQTVWDELVAFSTIEEPEEWLFRTGIAYPTHAEMEGRGVGAVRKCHFTTGPFIEPITIWDEPYILEFSVLDQPPPMIEWTIYQSGYIPHLEGYFRSRKGRFQLSMTEDDQVLLEGTTWYTHDIWPSLYWKLWSDAILHRIHLRVLNHIKGQAEVRRN